MDWLPGSDRYSRLLDCLDRAALDPAAWAEVCDGLAGLVGATGGMLVPYDAEDRSLAMPRSSSLDEVTQRFLEDGWHKKDFRAKGFPKAISSGFVTDQDLISRDEMRRHPYYAEFLAPLGLQWFAATTFNVNGKIWGAAVHASPSRGAFLSGDAVEIMRARDDLALAARRAEGLGRQRVESLEAAFAASNRGVAALGWSGKIAWLNARAEEMLRDAALASGGRIRSADPALERKLGELVESAMAFRPHSGAILSSPVLAPAGAGRMISVDAIPMPRDFQSLLSGASVLVTLHEVAAAKLAAGRDLRAQFHLTGREGELAAHLLSGRRLSHAAEIMGVSVSTARQYVKSIFAKTGTHGQAELVALLSRLDS